MEIKAKKETIIVVLLISLVALGIYTLNLKRNKENIINSSISPEAKVDYLNINDNEPILNDKFEYYALPNSEKKKTASSELTTYIVNEHYLQGYSQFSDSGCIKPKMCFVKDEINASQVDLNGDNIEEHIVMPWRVCDCPMRGASGNGDILVVKREGDKFVTMGELNGNGFTISKNKTNGYFDILANFHSSAATGTETIYKYQLISNGDDSTPGYEPALTKWYDLTRKNEQPVTRTDKIILSEEDAIKLVSTQAEVKEFVDLVNKNKRSTVGYLVEESPTTDNPNYTIKVYENFPDHITTFERYKVNSTTKKVEKVQP